MSINYVLIGDVHSQSNKLTSAINWVQSSIENYHIIFLGDLFDSRCDFSDSVGVYNMIQTLEQNHLATTIQSNHQHKLLRHYKGNRIVQNHGIDRTIAEFDADESIHKEVLYSWLNNLPYGVVFRDKFGTQYRAAHAFFSTKVEVPSKIYGLHKVYATNKKMEAEFIYGPNKTKDGILERIEWWKTDQNITRKWIRVAGHYHLVYINDDAKCLILDGSCGIEGGSLCAYDVNTKTLMNF